MQVLVIDISDMMLRGINIKDALAAADLLVTELAVDSAADISRLVEGVPLHLVHGLEVLFVLRIDPVVNLWLVVTNIVAIGRLEMERIVVFSAMVHVLFFMLLGLIKMINHLVLEHHELLQAHLVGVRDAGGQSQGCANRLKRHIY